MKFYKRNLAFHLLGNFTYTLTWILLLLVSTQKAVHLYKFILPILCVSYLIVLFTNITAPPSKPPTSEKIKEKAEEFDVSNLIQTTAKPVEWYKFITQLYTINTLTMIVTIFLTYFSLTLLLGLFSVYLILRVVGIIYISKQASIKKELNFEESPWISHPNKAFIQEIQDKTKNIKPFMFTISNENFESVPYVFQPNGVTFNISYVQSAKDHLIEVSRFPIAHEIGHTQEINAVRFYSVLLGCKSVPFIVLTIAYIFFTVTPLFGGFLFGISYILQCIGLNKFHRIQEKKADLFASQFTTPRERITSLLNFADGLCEPPSKRLQQLMLLFFPHILLEKRIEILSQENPSFTSYSETSRPAETE